MNDLAASKRAVELIGHNAGVLESINVPSQEGLNKLEQVSVKINPSAESVIDQSGARRMHVGILA